MPCSIEAGLYVRIEQLAAGPQPLPLASGFSTGTAYRVLGLESFSETSESYLILSNENDQIWFISNRHARTLGVFPAEARLRFPLAEIAARSESPSPVSLADRVAASAHGR